MVCATLWQAQLVSLPLATNKQASIVAWVGAPIGAAMTARNGWLEKKFPPQWMAESIGITVMVAAFLWFLFSTFLTKL